jgi:hypothetical protein
VPNDGTLLHKITGPKTETEYVYQTGSNALQSVINRSPSPDVMTPFGWAGSSGGQAFTPSRHDYTLNHLGQRTQHAQRHNYSTYWNIPPS